MQSMPLDPMRRLSARQQQLKSERTDRRIQPLASLKFILPVRRFVPQHLLDLPPERGLLFISLEVKTGLIAVHLLFEPALVVLKVPLEPAPVRFKVLLQAMAYQLL